MSDFRCPYADPGKSRCSPSDCDCFIEQYPEDPFGLHPEAFMVMVPCPGCASIGLVGGTTCRECGYPSKASLERPVRT